jgi:hypothetical protein
MFADDILTRPTQIGSLSQPAMTQPNSPGTTPSSQCAHKRTQLIAKDNDAQYVECLDCGELFEVGELPAGSQPDDKRKAPSEAPPGESLSDA